MESAGSVADYIADTVGKGKMAWMDRGSNKGRGGRGKANRGKGKRMDHGKGNGTGGGNGGNSDTGSKGGKTRKGMRDGKGGMRDWDQWAFDRVEWLNAMAADDSGRWDQWARNRVDYIEYRRGVRDGMLAVPVEERPWWWPWAGHI